MADTRRILTVIAILMLLLLPACSRITSSTGSSPIIKPNIERQAKLGEKWAMQQMTFDVPAEKEVKILLKLEDKNQVDGYFFLQKGDGIEFEVQANSLVYEAKSEDPKSPSVVTSDRFSFIASQAMGSTYTILFRNPDKSSNNSSVSVYTEVVYPATGTVFTEIVLKK